MSSASPIVPATDPLKTYTRLIALGANVQQAPASTRTSTRLYHCQKLITRLTLEARTDPQSVPGVTNGFGVHCSDGDLVRPPGSGAQGINYVGKPRRTFTDVASNAPEGSTLAQVAGPDAVDGIKDLTVGMGTVVNATAAGSARERFAIVSLGYAGKELKLDGLAAGNSSSSTVLAKSNGVWKQSESSAAGCVLTSIEAVYPSFISGVRLYFSCPATTQGASGDVRGFVLASASSTNRTTTPGPTSGTVSNTADALAPSGLHATTIAVIGIGAAILLVVAVVLGRLVWRRRKTSMFAPKV